MSGAEGTDDDVREAEAATEGAVAEEEAEREDAGREGALAHGGWRLQSQIFGGLALFIALIGTIYWFMSYETAGTTFLAVTSIMAAIISAFLGWHRPGQEGEDGGTDGGHELEPGHDPHDGVWFPEASIWPFAVGGSMVLVGNGFLLGRWMLIPALVLLVWSLAGLIRQGRHRI